jgi:hypothetical protein
VAGVAFSSSFQSNDLVRFVYLWIDGVGDVSTIDATAPVDLSSIGLRYSFRRAAVTRGWRYAAGGFVAT